MTRDMKYACLCIDSVVAHEVPEACHNLPAGFILAPPTAPFDLGPWQDELGRRQIGEIRDSNVHIWATRDAVRLDDVDSDNAQLVGRLHTFWKALLLTRPPLVHSVWIVSGRTRDGQPEVAMFEQPERITLKEPPFPPSIAGLAQTAETAASLEQVFENGLLRGRLERGLTAFLGAMRSNYLDEAILALERSLEGILHPANKEQFTKRAFATIELADHSDPVSVWNEIYDVRSGFTHAEPLEVVFQGKSADAAVERARRLQCLLYFAAARSFAEVLKSPDLVTRLSGEGLGEFWGKIVAGKRERPFRITIKREEWDFPQDNAHYFKDIDLFTRRSNYALQLTNPSRTLGTRS